MSSRQRFEGLLEQSLRMLARKPLKPGEKVVIESKRTFREGFKLCLIALNVIKESTTELNDEQLDMISSSIEETMGIKNPNTQE